MVAQPEETTAESQVLEWITDAVMEDGDLPAACRAAAAHVVSVGILPQLWEELGADMLDYLWRRVNSRSRTLAFRVTPGPRRIDTEALNQRASIMEQMVKLPDKRWVTVGDLTKSSCTVISEDYHKRTIELDRCSAFFAELAKRLRGDKTVREQLTEEEVQSILERIE